jgi:perosamine synthetase
VKLPIRKPTVLDADVLARMGDLLPRAEPALCAPPDEPGAPGRPLRVCEPRLDGNELAYVTQAIESNWISSAGPFVERFERAFAAAVDAAYGVSCSSGTAALHLTLASLELGPGDEVIVPTFTMIATANAVGYTGATPVFVDVDPVHWNIDPQAASAAITPRTRAIVAVHTYGHPAEMDALIAIARANDLVLIEDAAEAHGASYRGKKIGSIGDAGAFSFYGNKIVTTGEGGMMTTNDPEFAKVARRLRDHAFSPERHFWHEYRGFNYRMTNLQAALGLAQTERLESLVAQRRMVRDWYDDALSGVPGLRLPCEEAHARSVFWMYFVLVEDEFGCSRDSLRELLAARGIETRTAFVPLHVQPIYWQAGRGGAFPIAERVARRGLYLPSGPSLARSDIEFVAREVAAARA